MVFPWYNQIKLLIYYLLFIVEPRKLALTQPKPFQLSTDQRTPKRTVVSTNVNQSSASKTTKPKGKQNLSPKIPTRSSPRLKNKLNSTLNSQSGPTRDLEIQKQNKPKKAPTTAKPFNLATNNRSNKRSLNESNQVWHWNFLVQISLSLTMLCLFIFSKIFPS